MSEDDIEQEDDLPAPPKRDYGVILQAPRDGVPAPDPTSTMQQAVLDSGAKPIEGNPWAFMTNQGTVFLASPLDMKRSDMMDAMASARWARAHKPTNTEIDRLMKEDRD